MRLRMLRLQVSYLWVTSILQGTTIEEYKISMEYKFLLKKSNFN